MINYSYIYYVGVTKIMRKNLALIIIVIFAVSLISGMTQATEDINREFTLPFLEFLNVQPNESDILIEMRFNQSVEFDDFTLHNPYRFVIDVKGGWNFEPFKQLNFQDPMLKAVRSFYHKGGLRIVIELNYEGSEYDLFWDEEIGVLQLVIDRTFMKKTTTQLSEGVQYHQIKQGLLAGSVIVHALEVEINPYKDGQQVLEEIGKAYPLPNFELKATLRKGGLRSFSKVSDLVKQEAGLVGINGGFFGPSGYPLGLLISNERLVSAPIYDRTAWGIDKNGKMHIDRVSMQGEVIINNFARFQLSGFNRTRYGDELILYSPAFGKTTKTNLWGIEVVINDGRVVEVSEGNSLIPESGFVLSAHGAAKSILADLEVGDWVLVDLKLTPDWLEKGIVEAIGGGPGLVFNGIKLITGKAERFQPDVVLGRAPRTALGVTPDNRLLMVVVEGRSKYSIGMTLDELADQMIGLGASQAMNLDGGSSSTLVIKDKVFSSAANGEKAVHNGLVLKLLE